MPSHHFNSRRSSRRGSRYAGSSAMMNVRGGIGQSGGNYKSEGTGIFRHEFISKIPGLESIALGDYSTIRLLRFKRSFNQAEPDDPPVPTASNNYQSPNVFNGSSIRQFQASPRKFKFRMYIVW